MTRLDPNLPVLLRINEPPLVFRYFALWGEITKHNK